MIRKRNPDVGVVLGVPDEPAGQDILLEEHPQGFGVGRAEFNDLDLPAGGRVVRARADPPPPDLDEFGPLEFARTLAFAADRPDELAVRPENLEVLGARIGDIDTAL